MFRLPGILRSIMAYHTKAYTVCNFNNCMFHRFSRTSTSRQVDVILKSTKMRRLQGRLEAFFLRIWVLWVEPSAYTSAPSASCLQKLIDEASCAGSSAAKCVTKFAAKCAYQCTSTCATIFAANCAANFFFFLLLKKLTVQQIVKPS